jgi:hypothetical protein
MHASFEQLLKLRDAAGAEDQPSAHVRACAECGSVLARLSAVTAAMRRLQPRFAAPDRWSAIAAELSRSPSDVMAPRPRPGWLLPAASAALVLVVVLLTFGEREAPTPAVGAETATTIAPAATHADLLAESQRLESLLASLPAEPRITRAQTALTLADLEDRLQWVDYRISLASEVGLGREDAELLWRERVDLLNSLVAVRYAQTRTVAF